MELYSAVVSQVVPAGFADLADAADELPGQELTKERVQLKVQDRVGTGLPEMIRFDGTLRTTPALTPSIKVEVVISRWSAERSEVAIHPITNIGEFDSLRAGRFFKAARSILPAVVDRLKAQLPAQVPATLGNAA